MNEFLLREFINPYVDPKHPKKGGGGLSNTLKSPKTHSSEELHSIAELLIKIRHYVQLRCRIFRIKKSKCCADSETQSVKNALNKKK